MRMGVLLGSVFWAITITVTGWYTALVIWLWMLGAVVAIFGVMAACTLFVMRRRGLLRVK